MAGLFKNSCIFSKLGECNVLYKNNKYILLYLGFKNTTQSKQNFISNKKNHTLIFFGGNSGNSGNNLIKALKPQHSFVTIFGVFCYHCYHFPFCIDKLPSLFFKDFSIQLYILFNIYRSMLNALKLEQKPRFCLYEDKFFLKHIRKVVFEFLNKNHLFSNFVNSLIF